MDNTDKVVTFFEEAIAMGLKILPPNINRGQYRFVVEEGEILYGLGAIKGVGFAAVEIICAERERAGAFQNLFDFCRRVDLHKINKRVLEALIKSGAMDELGAHRAALLMSLEKAVATAEQQLKNQEQGQFDLFGTLSDMAEHSNEALLECPIWSTQERLLGEKATLGLYLSGHPLAQYEAELQHMTTSKIAQLKPRGQQMVIIAGIVVSVRVMQTKRGDRMAFVGVNDRSARMEIAVFSDVFAAHRDLLQEDQLLVVEGEASVDEYTGGYKLVAKNLMSIEQARARFAKHLLLTLKSDPLKPEDVSRLMQVLELHRGGSCPVCIAYHRVNAEALLPLGEAWRVQPTDDLLISLQETFPSSSVELVY
jgi:DNA polymerase-3 subunit alpha